jgi:hypothetical protein
MTVETLRVNKHDNDDGNPDRKTGYIACGVGEK